MTYRSDIDGLRAVAVLSVVFCHAGLRVPGGFIGVDVFFVISGYLITCLILEDIKRGTFSIFGFWERRVRRIFPALFVVCIGTAIIAHFVLLPSAYHDFGKSLFGITFFVSNIQFWMETGYFETSALEKPLLHTWSLAVEEQFYLFMPLLMIFLSIKRWLNYWVFIFLLIFSFGLSVCGLSTNPDFTFYWLPTRAWELLAGAWVCLWASNRFSGGQEINESTRRTSHFLREGLAIVALLLIVIPCFLYTEKTPFPGLAALPPVLGTTLLIGLGCNQQRLPWINRLLANRLCVWVGLISYSLYLWHWPLLALARYFSYNPLWFPYRVVIVILSLSLAYLTWRWIEQPFRKRQFCASRRAVFIFFTSGLTVMLLIAGILVYTHGLPTRFNQREQRMIETARRDYRYFQQHIASDVPIKLNRFGVIDKPVSLLVWGDSQAQAILPAIDVLANELQIHAVGATHTGTPPVLGYFSSAWSIPQDAVRFNRAVMDYIISQKIPKVVLVSLWTLHIHNDTEYADYLDKLKTTIKELREAEVAVYVVCQIPTYSPQRFYFDYYTIHNRHLRLQLSMDDYKRQVIREQAVSDKLDGLGVHYLNPDKFLPFDKEKKVFIPYDEEGFLYADGGHLSSHGALKLLPMLQTIFTSSQEVKVTQ